MYPNLYYMKQANFQINTLEIHRLQQYDKMVKRIEYTEYLSKYLMCQKHSISSRSTHFSFHKFPLNF